MRETFGGAKPMTKYLYGTEFYARASASETHTLLCLKSCIEFLYGFILLPQVAWQLLFYSRSGARKLSHGMDGVKIPALMRLHICILGQSPAVLKHWGGGGPGAASSGFFWSLRICEAQNEHFYTQILPQLHLNN